jgi:hypothetical protein
MTENNAKLPPALEKTKESRKRTLFRTYDSVPQIGLFLGAGVTKTSGVPLYYKMTLELCQRAIKEKWLKSNTPPEAIEFLEEQAKRVEQNEDETAKGLASFQITPEEIALFLTQYLEDRTKLSPMLYKTLYKNIKKLKPKSRMISRETWKNNMTLNSVISFCAQLPADSKKPELNPKVGGILTTNYDFIVEASFNGKFRKELMEPITKLGSPEFRKETKLLPVYHIHGYVSYNLPKKQQDYDTSSEYPQEVKALDLLIAEGDYFHRFYDPLGFSTFVALNFLNRFPCLFIGTSMKDRNIRRFLYHLEKERREMVKKRKENKTVKPKHFAILPTTGTSQDSFTDAILWSYGISAIWIRGFDEINTILKQLYCYPINKKRDYKKVQNWNYEEWNNVYEYTWP